MPLEVSGISTLLRSLETLTDPETIQGITRESLRTGGLVLQERMRAASPIRVDSPTSESTSLEPGALREGIDLYINKVDDKGTVSAVVAPNKYVRHVARWVEKGHNIVKRSAKGKAIYGRVPPRPFLRRTWESAQPELKETVRQDLRARVKQLLGR